MIDSGGHKVKSRSLTGPSARFGMTRLIFEWFLSQRWKRCATQRLYAALKRRSSTVVLAAVVVLLVRRRGQKQIRVKGDGRGCPSHTGWPRGLKPGFFFSDPNRHEWNSCPSRFLEGWVRCGAGESQQQVPPVSLRSRVGMTGVVVGVGLFAALEAAHPKALSCIRGGNALLGRQWCAGGRDPSTAHNVHFVDVMLRSG
jgi:hypothetical protein